MFWTKKAQLDIGGSVCDMHYGLPPEKDWENWLDRHVKVNHIVLEIEGGSDFIQNLLKKKTGKSGLYTNKMLVYIGGIHQLEFIYSYDDRRIGFVTVKIL